MGKMEKVCVSYYCFSAHSTAEEVRPGGVKELSQGHSAVAELVFSPR